MGANRAESLDSLDPPLRDGHKVVVEVVDLVPVRHHHRDARGHALDVRLVVDGVVEHVVEHAVDLLELNRVVVW